MVPIPNASAPNAPWVLVWLSPHTMVMPGWVAPSSGLMTCTMPRLRIAHAKQFDAEFLRVAFELLHLLRCGIDLDRHIPKKSSLRVGVE